MCRVFQTRTFEKRKLSRTAADSRRSRNGPGGSDGHQWMATTITAAAPDRDDIRGFADLLDLDDFVSYGGKA